jgi:phosphodiesterase/alkaline phosphatase D-like protein
LDGPAGEANFADLKPLTKYYFRMNAQSQYGTVTGTAHSFTTTGPAAPGAPSAHTMNVTNNGTSTAALNGRVNPNGAITTYWFEYGIDSVLGSVLGSTTHTQTTNGGTSDMSVTAKVTSLNHDTRYYVRLVTENSIGTTRGEIVTFKTKQ